MSWIDAEIKEVVREHRKPNNRFTEKESSVMVKLILFVALIALLFYPQLSTKAQAAPHSDAKTTWCAYWTCRCCGAVHPNALGRCPYCGEKKHTKW